MDEISSVLLVIFIAVIMSRIGDIRDSMETIAKNTTTISMAKN